MPPIQKNNPADQEREHNAAVLRSQLFNFTEQLASAMEDTLERGEAGDFSQVRPTVLSQLYQADALLKLVQNGDFPQDDNYQLAENLHAAIGGLEDIGCIELAFDLLDQLKFAAAHGLLSMPGRPEPNRRIG